MNNTTYKTIRYYFVAYYAPNKAYTYDAEKNAFLPYAPIYRRRYKDYEQALRVVKHARRKHPDKRQFIFLDCGTSWAATN